MRLRGLRHDLEKRQRALVGAATSSLSRVAITRTEVSATLRSDAVKESVGRVVDPRSLIKGMRRLGVVLVAAPDPITGIPGAALLASSYILKRREPANLKLLAAETKKLMRDIQSLSL